MNTSTPTRTRNAAAVTPKGRGPAGRSDHAAGGGSHRLSARQAFFREFLRNPTGMAAVAPSSRGLAKRMLEGLDFGTMSSVIEFGPGTGVFTEQIERSIPRGWLEIEGGKGKVVTIDLNPRMVEIVRANHPRLTVREGSAADVEAIAQREGIEPGTVDAVISGLGFASFPPALITSVLEATHRVLKPGGVFRTFTYHVSFVKSQAYQFRSEARRVFGGFQSSRVVWLNVPPAFVYTCRKA